MVSFFVDDDAAQEFARAFMEALAALQKQAVAQVLGNKTPQRFAHGRVWEAPVNSPSLPGKIRQHSAQLETRFEDIANHNLGILPLAFQQLSQSMHAQFMQTLYTTVSDACATTGNIVDAKQKGSLQEAFIEMLERIEFIADRDGTVSMPQLHAGSEAFEKFRQMLESASPEFAQRVEAVKARKTQEAVEREAARKAKFVSYGK